MAAVDYRGPHDPAVAAYEHAAKMCRDEAERHGQVAGINLLRMADRIQSCANALKPRDTDSVAAAIKEAVADD